MIVQYYLHARAYLIDPAVMPLEPWQAIALSVGSMLGRLADLRTAVPLAARQHTSCRWRSACSR